MLKIPVENITNVDMLMDLLTVDNPEYENSKRFNPVWGKKVPEFLRFYELHETDKIVEVPRNISVDFYNGEVSVLCSKGFKLDLHENPSFSLRDYQKDYFNDSIIPAINRGETDLNFTVPCGHGKTLMSLYLSSLRNRNTLILVTKHALAKQFIDAVKFMFPKNTVSMFSDKKSYVQTDFVVSTYDLMSDDRFDENFFGQYGHLICDEVHRIGATTYRGIMAKSPCLYRTSLSATFRRRDGLHKILSFHCGNSYKMGKQTPEAMVFPILTGVKRNLNNFKNIDKAQTRLVKIPQYTECQVLNIADNTYVDGQVYEHGGNYYVKPFNRPPVMLTQKETKVYIKRGLSVATLDTNISEDVGRNKTVSELIDYSLHKGRTILVLSKRKEQLYNLSKEYDSKGVPNGVVASQKSKDQKEYCDARGMTLEEQEEFCTTKARVTFGIDKIAEEGYDDERLDTLILVHPLKDIEQAKGRVEREFIGKKYPTVLYLLDDINNYSNSWVEAKDMFYDLGSRVFSPKTVSEFKEFIDK